MLPLLFKLVASVASSLESMKKLAGSSNQIPPLPFEASVLTTAFRIFNSLPEVSTRPPKPPLTPPLAKILPCTSVTDLEFVTSDQMTTFPPLPF